jgi:TolA-binding protein
VAAAQEFISLVNANPDFEDADKALLNAAQSLQDAHRYEESAQVFERVVTDPSFRNSQYHERALFSLSENYKKFYNFDKAIWGYKTLYEKYPKSENAPYSLFQAAELFQYNQQYDQAIPLFEQYTKVFRARPDSAGVAWRVIALYEKEGDERKLVDALRGFIAGYYDNPGVAAQVVEAHLKLANLYLARGDERNARQYYQKTVQEFDRRGFQPGSPQAAFASEARFQLVEYDFRVYEAIKLVGSVEAQGAAIARKQRMLGELEKKYADVFPYKALDWTVAAYFRTGQIYQLFAKALYDAPVPDMAEEEMEIYRTELEDAASKWENTAIERYETTITNARALNVMNDWTKKTLEALNAYKPAEYPLFKEEKKFFLTDLQE